MRYNQVSYSTVLAKPPSYREYRFPVFILGLDIGSVSQKTLNPGLIFAHKYKIQYYLTIRPTSWRIDINIVLEKMDWDNIKDITGDKTWGHKPILEYFKKLERNLYLPKDTPGHGFSGYQSIGRANKTLIESDKQVIAITKASDEALGYSERAKSNDFNIITNWDINEDQPDRNFLNNIYQISFKKDEQEKRFSAGSRVNQGINKGLSLTVRFDSFITKIKLDDDLRATSIKYLEGEALYRTDPRAASKNTTGIPRSVTAKREIIITGSTFNTPQILIHSGISPAEHLKEHNIPVVVDLPGLQGKGPWTTLGFYEFILYTSIDAPRGERNLILYGVSGIIFGYVLPYTNSSELSKINNKYTYTISESHPHNKAGTITLTSSDPLDIPEINFRYFIDGGNKDIQGLVNSIEFTRKIFDSVPGGTVGEVYPGRNISSQQQLQEFIRNKAYSYHASSTASIGSNKDPLVVLDSHFRVRGVKGLRVTNASVFPVTPGTFSLISLL
uniref:Glucose-methanol-choline oxidoreductase C-terminal domain-containing protein n=1 Tax=Bionectria ochroleuca TaxID=29856 RepID=A0A8H7K451_BIOOC